MQTKEEGLEFFIGSLLFGLFKQQPVLRAPLIKRWLLAFSPTKKKQRGGAEMSY